MQCCERPSAVGEVDGGGNSLLCFLGSSGYAVVSAGDRISVLSLSTVAGASRHVATVQLPPLTESQLEIQSLCHIDGAAMSDGVLAHFCVSGRCGAKPVVAGFALVWCGEGLVAQLRLLRWGEQGNGSMLVSACQDRSAVIATSTHLEVWSFPDAAEAAMATKAIKVVQAASGDEAVCCLAGCPSKALFVAGTSAGNVHVFFLSEAQSIRLVGTCRPADPSDAPTVALCLPIPSAVPPTDASSAALGSTMLWVGHASGALSAFWLGHLVPSCAVVDPPVSQGTGAQAAPAEAAGGATAPPTQAPCVGPIPPLATYHALHASGSPVHGLLCVSRLATVSPADAAAPDSLQVAVWAAGAGSAKILPITTRPPPQASCKTSTGAAHLSFAEVLAASTPSERKAAGWSHTYGEDGRLVWTPPPLPDEAWRFERYASPPSLQQAVTAPFVSMAPDSAGRVLCATTSPTGDALFALAQAGVYVTTGPASE